MQWDLLPPHPPESPRPPNLCTRTGRAAAKPRGCLIGVARVATPQAGRGEGGFGAGRPHISWGPPEAPSHPGAPREASLPGDPSPSALNPNTWSHCPGPPSGGHLWTDPGRVHPPSPLSGDRLAPPTPTKFNKFDQEFLEPPWLGLAGPLRVGSELCSAGLARGAKGRGP